MQYDRFKVRVGVVVLDESNRLLLARQNRRPFWVLPGGTLEMGETIGECAVREIKEESNLDITLGPLLYVGDFFVSERKQVLDLVFYSRLQPGGTLTRELSENLDEIGFFTLEEAAAMELKPERLFEPIRQSWKSGEWPSGSYLGGYST